MAKDTKENTGNTANDTINFSLSVSEGGLSKKYTIPVSLSFSGLTRRELIELTIPGLRVRLQNSWRKRGDSFCADLAKRGAQLHVNALDISVTDGELIDTIIAAYETLGTPAPERSVLESLIANPDKRAELVSRFYNKK